MTCIHARAPRTVAAPWCPDCGQRTVPAQTPSINSQSTDAPALSVADTSIVVAQTTEYFGARQPLVKVSTDGYAPPPHTPFRPGEHFAPLQVRRVAELDPVRFPEVEDSTPRGCVPEHGESKIMTFVARSITVELVNARGTKVTLIEFSDSKIHGLISDRRLIYGCSEYVKGGGWVGFGGAAILFSIIANMVSKAKVKKRRAGSALVGQVNYSWISRVGFSRRQSVFDSNTLRVVAYQECDPFAATMITFNLVPDDNADAIAHALATQAASWKLENDVHRAHYEQELRDLIAMQPIRSSHQHLSFHNIPGCIPLGTTYQNPNS